MHFALINIYNMTYKMKNLQKQKFRISDLSTIIKTCSLLNYLLRKNKQMHNINPGVNYYKYINFF